MERLKTKTAIITGGTKGIGKGIAKIFALEGANVVIVGQDKMIGQKAADEISKIAKRKVLYCKVNITRSADLQSAVDTTVKTFGNIDILCCNAGIYPSSPLETMTENEWDLVNSVNLKGTFLTLKTCLPIMKRNIYGKVVLTSSITGPITGYPGWAHYGATKAGMLGFMRTSALELAKYNITINAVLPGNIYTEALKDLGDDYIRTMEKSIPLKKLGTIEDIGYAALFLSTDESKFITGQSIVVDGGQILPESLEAIL
ncbi:MAG: 3-oxoacyl-ACP reductase FabG [Candidatus Scalindua sp.]|jgi:3-oxoacyl-[acyl-carrier protein] reductase|nr:3-oxoacyl-ACP reductase FabG [Candidatus Scalindua sp.]MBT7210378.1 3-oxoacyl-ACP reductase FabG [Candidatus Scalindua sp.]MBT7591336.1 3-oxoacyl-ACP reductase FabG [Candidatus Scalindua sp.]